EILAELHARGIRIESRPRGGVRLVPARLIGPDLLNRIHRHKTELLVTLHAAKEVAEIDRLACADGWTPLPPTGHPAYSILDECRRFGVALRIDEGTGDLLVGKAAATADEPTQPWRSLLA